MKVLSLAAAAFSVALALPLSGAAPAAGAEPAPPRPWGLAFGSCSRTNLPQPVWDTVRELGVDAWCWLGDNVYADTRDPARLRAEYDRQRAVPGYARLLAEQRVPILGTWDDHDYGQNDAGKEYPRRPESQQAFLDFLGESPDSPRRRREGIYEARVFECGGRRVKLLVLDTRYHRDPIGSDGTVLGEAQWAWLESELKDSTADLHIVVSSIQVLAEDHRFEKWANFPSEKRRLLERVAALGTRGVVFLSGDRHHAEISRLDPGPGNPVPYALHDLTASSLTHPRRPDGKRNRFRLPGTEIVYEKNFGLLRVDWVGRKLTVQFLAPADGRELLRHEIPFDAIGVR